MDRDEVMKTLGKSQSTLERLVMAGEIKTKLKPVPHRKPMRLYSSEDVERLTQEAARKEARVALRPRSTPPSVAQLPAPSQNGTKPAVDPSEKLWLTVEEAEYCGLPQGFLLRLARNGDLHAVKTPQWRIQRASLEEFSRKGSR